MGRDQSYIASGAAGGLRMIARAWIPAATMALALGLLPLACSGGMTDGPGFAASGDDNASSSSGSSGTTAGGSRSASRGGSGGGGGRSSGSGAGHGGSSGSGSGAPADAGPVYSDAPAGSLYEGGPPDAAGSTTLTLTMDPFVVAPGAEVYKCQQFANPFGK